MKRAIFIAAGIAAVGAVAWFSLRDDAVEIDEVAEVQRRAVRSFISEEAETRLDDSYIIDAPVGGTVSRIELEPGDGVQQGEVVAAIDAFDIRQQIAATEALIEQAKAQIEGVDVGKPKAGELESARVRVDESADAQQAAAREREIAEINLEDAQRHYERMRDLHAEGAVSQAEFEEAQRAFNRAQRNVERLRIAEETAGKSLRIASLAEETLRESVDDNEYMREVYRAEIQRLQADLARLQDDLEEATVRSPVDGVVLERFVESELVVSPGMRLLEIGDLTTIEIESDVLSEEAPRIAQGDPVEITGSAVGGQTVTGEVARIYPAGFKKISALGIEQQRVKVIIDFDNRMLQLRPGTSVDVRIVTDQTENALAVPERALFRHEDGWAVFRAVDGEALLTPVDVGVKNSDWAAVASGLEEGEHVISDVDNDLSHGARIQIALE
jgi:HlyD family secretion protein